MAQKFGWLFDVELFAERLAVLIARLNMQRDRALLVSFVIRNGLKVIAQAISSDKTYSNLISRRAQLMMVI